MQAVAEYIKTLASFMIFSAIIGILSPSSSFSKYINIVTGLILIGFLLEPISNVLNNTDGMLNAAYYKYEQSLNKYSMQKTELINNEQTDKTSEQIILEYKKRLNEQTALYLLSQTGAQTESCEFIVEENYNSEQFGEIYALHLTILSTFDEGAVNAFNAVAYGEQNAPPKKDDVNKYLELYTKKCLSDFYNISEHNIHITVR